MTRTLLTATDSPQRPGLVYCRRGAPIADSMAWMPGHLDLRQMKCRGKAKRSKIFISIVYLWTGAAQR